MSTNDLTSDLASALDGDPDQLRLLRDRLAAAAQAEGILDIAYRTVDSPVGPLLLAATEVGLVRVAYAAEDHD
jgi:methylated-DNA-[protein]-cysteine S-methyltransferase